VIALIAFGLLILLTRPAAETAGPSPTVSPSALPSISFTVAPATTAQTVAPATTAPPVAPTTAAPTPTPAPTTAAPTVTPSPRLTTPPSASP